MSLNENDAIETATTVHLTIHADSHDSDDDDSVLHHESPSHEAIETELGQPPSHSRQNSTAFSSSSDDDDNYKPSEWDKAVLSGVVSKARATSEVFHTEGDPAATGGALPISIEEGSKSGEQSLSVNSSSSQHPGPMSSNNVASWMRIAPNHPRQSEVSSTVPIRPPLPSHPTSGSDLSSGVLPDVLLNMRQQIESMSLFDSDMMKLADDGDDTMNDPMTAETRESLKRSSQQSISPAVLVSLAHKRYERRRLAAMEIEKVVRSLAQQNEWERVRAILLLLSDDYVRSTSEDARKGGVVALAASAIGIKKKAAEDCQDLILASVVHACQDHSQRVRYYATESLFNVVKVLPSLANQHFFILFEILRSLYADVDADVRSGAELLDKKLKEIILSAMNSGTFSVDACVPVFARFVHIRNKATKLLTLTWLQELNEKLVGAPVLPYLHLFLGGIFDMVADPTIALRQSALAFLQSVLPKLLTLHSPSDQAIDTVGDDEDVRNSRVDFDQILQSLVTTMEHPDPFVRKVAMYWMSRIVKAHMTLEQASNDENNNGEIVQSNSNSATMTSVSVRNSVPHLLPGILLCIGDTYHASGNTKETFLPDQTTRALAEQTNKHLQEAVRRDGSSYIHHLDAFIVALREELDSPGGVAAKNPPALERAPFRMDVTPDGNGIETPGWFRASSGTKDRNDEAMIQSRLCALDWVTVLYEHVVPTLLKAEYAREFIFAIINQLEDNPPTIIVEKSLEVLAKVTIPVLGEDPATWHSSSEVEAKLPSSHDVANDDTECIMSQSNVEYALEVLDQDNRLLKSRDRRVFSALIELLSIHEHLLANFSNVLTYMCTLQPPAFVFVSFSVEVDRFVRRRSKDASDDGKDIQNEPTSLHFVSSFVQHMSHALIHAQETKQLRDVLKDSICSDSVSDDDRQRCILFHILLHSFSHNIGATVSLCLWSGAYRTASEFLTGINPLDINLINLLEIDKVVEMLERPFFRHLHVRMLEKDADAKGEGNGTMLFKLLKSLLMILPQGTCYNVLKDRLTSVARFRQTTLRIDSLHFGRPKHELNNGNIYVQRIEHVRSLHCNAKWRAIRADSLEVVSVKEETKESEHQEGTDRRSWLGYASKEEEDASRTSFISKSQVRTSPTAKITDIPEYHELSALSPSQGNVLEELTSEISEERQVETELEEIKIDDKHDDQWKKYWADTPR